MQSYEHVTLEQDDLICNLDELKALEKLEACENITRAKEWRKNHNIVNLVVFFNIQDPIDKMNEKIAHMDEIIEGVSSYTLKRDTRRSMGTSI